MDEKPVSLKRKHLAKPAGRTTRQCIIHIQGAATKKDEIKALTETSWRTIKSTVQKLSECSSSSQHSFICQEIPLEPDYDAYGFHRECYKRFTNVRNVSTKRLDSDKDYVPPCKKRRPSGNILFPSDLCIICDKKEHWIHKGKARVRDRLVKCVTKDAETTLKLAAEQKEDEETLRKIAGQDLIAREAHYHQLCRSLYTKNIKWGPALPKPENLSEIAHAEAFTYLSTYIDNEMIENHVIVRMNFLKSLYLTYIQEKYPSVYNPNYKTDKLKDKIVKKYSNILTFVKTNIKHSEIVFCDSIETKTAVSQVYELSSSERNVLERAAGILRQRIIEASENYCTESWPPSKEYLESAPVPTSVTHFLQSVFRSPTSKNMSYLLEQKINSIGQDMCYCVTRGSWQMPKHLLIGMTIHHLTASAEVITLLNRLGHCISYSKVLELETAIAEKILITDQVLPPSIIQANSKFVHYCWDNFDLCEETPSGAGTTHSTHGIVIQERISENESESAETINIPKVKKRSLQTHTHELPPCHMKNIEPKILTVQDINTDISFPKVDISHFLWFVCRLSLKSLVPDWFGWLNKTEQNVSNLSSVVEYLRPIHNPATENATIQEVMKRSLLGSEECGQQNTVITMDLATAKKAYAIQWNSPELYKHVFLRLGTFHIICAYFHGLGKLLESSGFEEIILESGICANGSLQGVMSGKHYNRALRIHATLAEAFDRLLWFEFSIKFNVTNKLKGIENELENYGICSNLLDIDSHQNGEDVKSLIDDYENERHKIRTGERGLTQQFWLNYIDKVWTALNLLRAVKTNDFNQYKTCLKAMVPLFFSMDQQNYARYLSLYVANLDAIDDTHPEAAKFIRECALSVRRVNRPASGIPVDQTIEQTINRSAKSCGGIIGMSRNTQAYDRWCLTRHERGIYAVRAFSWVNMYDEKDALGKRNRESEIIRSLNDVEKATEAIKNFSNPFEILQDEGLMCLSSCKTIPKETAKAITEMNTSGMTAYQNFVKERLQTGETSFFAPIKRQNLTTFGSLKKVVKVRSASADKTIKVKAQRNVCAQALMLCHEHNIDVQRIFSYPMGPVPWALASSDGSRAKTNKAVLMHKLESNITTNETYDTITSDFIYIMDGNVLFHCVKNVPETFGMLAQTLFHMLPASNEIHFVTDTYKDISIKSFERNNRGYSDTFNIKGPATKVPKNFHQFLCSDSNKKQLIRLLLSEWSSDKYAPHLKSRKIFFVCEESCYSISSQDGTNTDCQPIMNLESSQEEADTRVVLHIDFLLQSNSNSNIVVRSTDTDVFILLLYFHCTWFKSSNLELILFDTGVGDKRKLVNIGKIASSYPTDLILALPGFHAFTGCDSTSAFVRQGKLKPFRLLERNPKYHTSFQILGSSVIVEENTRTEMEEFTCLMYGSNKIKSVDSLRFIKAKEKFSSKGSLISADENTDMSLLPPCLKSLNLHVTRANYQAMIWKKATESRPDVPAPMHNGWKFENDSLAIDWGEEMFPREIIDVLEDDLGSDIDDDMEDSLYVDIPESYDSN